MTDTQVSCLMQAVAPKKPTRNPDPHEALALMQRGRVRGHGRRSPIVVWMQKNRLALEKGFAETTPSWGKLATYLGDHGILDGDGKRPTAEATRQAWYRARNMAVSGGQQAPAGPVASRGSAIAASPAVVEKAAPPAPRRDETEPARRTFGVATPRGLHPAAKAASPVPTNAETPTSAATVDVDEVLARFSGKPGTTRR